MILENFRPTAKECLLFTGLEIIDAKSRRSASLPAQQIWSACISRSGHVADGAMISRGSIQECSVGRLSRSEAWIIITSTVPTSRVPTKCNFRGEKEIRIGLAASLDNGASFASKFFSTIPLAITTSPPLHVNASFFLASDRRSIRHDAHDTDETSFNKWLLSEPLPEIYLQLLTEIVKDTSLRNSRWWPGSALGNDEDDDYDDDLLAENKDEALTTVLVNSFYRTHLPSTQRKVCSSRYSTEMVSPQEARLCSSRLPSPIQDLLYHMRPRDIVRLRIPKSLRKLGGLLSVTPEYIKAIILLSTTKSLSFIKALPHRDFNEIAEYLASTNANNLCGLPLLHLQNRQWDTFALRGANQPKYVWNYPTEGLFDTSQFVEPAYLPPKLVARLVAGGLNVADLDSPALKSLVEDVLDEMVPSAQSTWVTKFWDSYPDFSLSGLLPAIEDLPLVPTASGDFISLARCKTGHVLLSDVFEEEDILADIQDLGIAVVTKKKSPSNLEDILWSREYAKVGTFFGLFLQALKGHLQNARQTMQRWPEERCKRFSAWFCPQLSSRLPADLISTAKELPVWRAQRQRQIEWKAATDVKCLPRSLSLPCARFLSVFVCTDRNSQHLGVEPLSWQDLGTYIQVPDRLASDEEDSYLLILEGILKHKRSPNTSVWLPNSTRKMVLASSLYARQPLFEAAFDTHADTFLLPSFSRFEQRLRNRDLIKHMNQLNMHLFYECASALHQASSPNKTTRAAVLFNTYGEDLPLCISSASKAQWDMVNQVRFIPRDMATTRLYSRLLLPLPGGIQALPEVVSPNELVRQGFESIAWTQRALFATQPNSRVLLTNPDLGKPSVSEVVSCGLQPNVPGLTISFRSLISGC